MVYLLRANSSICTVVVSRRAGVLSIKFSSRLVLQFPLAGNARLACATTLQLKNVHVSRLGLHWPDLDEDLSFAGLLAGRFGEKT